MSVFNPPTQVCEAVLEERKARTPPAAAVSLTRLKTFQRMASSWQRAAKCLRERAVLAAAIEVPPVGSGAAADDVTAAAAAGDTSAAAAAAADGAVAAAAAAAAAVAMDTDSASAATTAASPASASAAAAAAPAAAAAVAEDDTDVVAAATAADSNGAMPAEMDTFAAPQMMKGAMATWWTQQSDADLLRGSLRHGFSPWWKEALEVGPWQISLTTS